MNILYIIADDPNEYNCAEWRMEIPLRAINKTGGNEARKIHLTEFLKQTRRDLIEWANLVILQRLMIANAIKEVLFWRAHGAVVAVDIDDSYQHMTDDNMAYNYWIKGHVMGKDALGNPELRILNEKPLETLSYGLKLADALISPSELICRDWSEYTRTYRVPNYMEEENYVNRLDETGNDLTIGWAGGTTHLTSFKGSGVLHALKNICGEFPYVQLAIGGEDKRIFDALPVPATRKSMAKLMPVKEFWRVLDSFDIGIAPLSGAYDDRRSGIRLMELMAMEKPIVASDSPPHQEFKAFATLVRNTPQAWTEGLRWNIQNLAKAREKARACRPWVITNWSIENNVGKVLATYQQIIDDARSRK